MHGARCELITQWSIRLHTQQCVHSQIGTYLWGTSTKARNKSSTNQMEEDKMPIKRTMQHRRTCGAMCTKGRDEFEKGASQF